VLPLPPISTAGVAALNFILVSLLEFAGPKFTVALSFRLTMALLGWLWRKVAEDFKRRR